MSETTNPYGAPAAAASIEATRQSRIISAAIWCGFVPPFLIGLLGIYWIVKLAMRAISMGQSFTTFVAIYGEMMLALTCLVAVLALALAYGIYKRSRICAALVFTAWAIPTLWDGAHGRIHFDSYIAIPAVLLAISLIGVIGTVLHHRSETRQENGKDR